MAKRDYNSAPEGFKEVPGYESRYFINREGQIWSAIQNKILRTYRGKSHPYPYIKAIKNGKPITTRVYYFMRLAWMPPAPGLVGVGRDMWCVNHRDGNKENNHIDNLEWVTCAENVSHAWRNGLCKPLKGRYSPNARLTSEQVREIRLSFLEGRKASALGIHYKVARETIHKIVWFLCWTNQDYDLLDRMLTVSSCRYLRESRLKIQASEDYQSWKLKHT